MAGPGYPDGWTALAAIAAGCMAAAAAMLAPLGDRERIALAFAAGILAALIVVAAIVIRRRIAARPPAEAYSDEADAPTLRREDLHPDAPPRRPIFAVADLGVPEAEEQSVPDLLERFERGLERRNARVRLEAEAADSGADVDEALRDALGTLKQMASRVS